MTKSRSEARAMSEQRRRLPNRREHEVIRFDHCGFQYVAGLGRFEDGGLGEIFLAVAKSGDQLDTHARDSSILASLALQYGAPPDVIRHALTRNGDGSASGAIGRLLDMLAGQL
jgi:hypothetical protein